MVILKHKEEPETITANSLKCGQIAEVIKDNRSGVNLIGNIVTMINTNQLSKMGADFLTSFDLKNIEVRILKEGELIEVVNNQ